MAEINYNAALPALPLLGRPGLNVSEWLQTVRGNLSFLAKNMFANNEQGFMLDYGDYSTLFQDAAGTTPVTGAGQPVGLVLDKSKGLVVGSELTPQAALWTGSANWTVDVQNAKATLVNSSASSDDLSLGTVSASYIGQVFEIRFRILSISGGSATVDSSRLIGVAPPQYSSPGMYRYFAYANNTGTGSLRININTAGVSCVIDNISVRELPGNHAYQATSAARPLLQNEPILGPNLVTNGDFSNGGTAWSATGTPTFTFDTGRAYYNGVGGGASGQLFNDVGMTVGKTYKVSYDYEVIQYGFMAGCVHSKTIGGRTITGKGRRHFIITVTDARDKGVYFAPENTSYTCEFYIDNVTVQEIIGYNKNIKKVAYDRIDDKLITNLPAQLTGCTVIRSVPNVGTQILTGQTIPATYEDNQDHCGLIVINRALTQTETAQITRIFNKLAGV